MLTRERRPMSAALLLPLPAPLPGLRDTLQRRAAIFGPFDADPAPAAPHGAMARCAVALRSLADMLEPARVLS